MFIACGTSYHAALVGKFLIEGAARIPCEVDLASEFRYRDPVVGPGDLVVAVSQSGETADTLAAVKEARARGSRILAICNVVDSSIPRSSHGALYTHAGPEIGVASTKCFTAQLAALALLAIYLGRRTGTLTPDAAAKLLHRVRRHPAQDGRDARGAGRHERAFAQDVQGRARLPVPGARHQLPDRARGRAQAEGDLVHPRRGLRRRRDEARPDRADRRRRAGRRAGAQGPGYEKVLSNLAEVRARKGRSSRSRPRATPRSRGRANACCAIPDAPAALQPFLTVLPLQLLSYAIALAKGTDVDQPRNLAKSVTVE